MLSEDYYGFNAASPRSNHRLISYRTQLSAEKVINSKSREKKKMEDQQLQKLKKKYDVSKNYNPDREKSKSRKTKERYDQIHSNNMKFRFHHYDDRGYYENNKQVKKRVEQRALQALEKNLSPKQNSIVSASGRNGHVSQKLTRQVQQILSYKRMSRNVQAQTTRQIKSPPSHRASLVESVRSSSSNSHRHLRKMKPEEKRASKIQKDQNVYYDQYNLRANKEQNSAITPKQSMILGTQTIRKQYQSYEVVNTSQKGGPSKERQRRQSQLIQREQIELSQISLSSNGRYNNQLLPVQFSRTSDNMGIGAQPQILATSDYERIKQLQQKAKDQSILIASNKNIQYNNVPPMTSTLRSKYELHSNPSIPSHSNSNILSKVIKDSSEILKSNSPQIPSQIVKTQVYKVQTVETYPYKSPPSAQQHEGSFEFILNEGPSNQNSNHSSRIESLSPSNLNNNNNIVYSYGQAQGGHPQYPEYWQRTIRNGQKSNRSSLSSFNLSQTYHQQYDKLQPQIDSNNLRMSITNDNILNNSNVQPYSVNMFSNNQMPTPPIIFQRPTQQNMLLNSFNLLDALKQWTEVEDKKMCGLYSGFGSENQNLQKMMDKLYEHLAAINKISDFVEETEKFYIDNQQKQLFHICSFLLLKRFYSQRTKVIDSLRSGNSCFILTDKQVSTDQIQKLSNAKIVREFISQIDENNKMIYNLLQRFYLQLKQQGYPPSMVNLQEPTKQDTHLIMQKLNQQLELLINKIDQNEHSNQKSSYEKDNEYEVISLRSFSIMQLVFLISQLEGRKTKKLQESIEPEDFEMYCKTHYSSYKETILYFH